MINEAAGGRGQGLGEISWIIRTIQGDWGMQHLSLIAVFRALNEAKVKYLVVGGIAVIAHGHQRLTRDLDLVIRLEPDNLIKALRALQGVGYRPALPVKIEDFCDAQIRQSWIEEKGMMVFQMWSDLHRTLPIDVFITEPFDFETAYRDASVDEVEDDISIRIVDLERLISMKREAGRERDLLDIEQLMDLAKLRLSDD